MPDLLTKPIEEAVGVIRNVRLVRSVSRSGQSDVTLEFLWGTDMDIAGVDVHFIREQDQLDLLGGLPFNLFGCFRFGQRDDFLPRWEVEFAGQVVDPGPASELFVLEQAGQLGVGEGERPAPFPGHAVQEGPGRESFEVERRGHVDDPVPARSVDRDRLGPG